MKRISRRWLPAILAPVLVAGSIFFTGQARAVDLPDKSAAEILAMMTTDENLAFSGRIVKKADLGLPPMNIIPDISQSMVDSMAEKLPPEMADFIPEASIEGELALVLEFLAGTHNANVFVDGATKARVQVLDLLSERNFIRNGKDLWFYDAAKSEVVHTEIDPVKEAEGRRGLESWLSTNAAQFPFEITSPASVANYLIDEAGESTNFTVDEDASVAGRGAYQLIMTPKAEGSLFESVKVAIDAETGLPLAVTAHAVGKSDPAFEIAFASISFAKPEASIFDFVPPAGATVEKLDGKSLEELAKKDASSAPTLSADELSQLEAEVEAEAERLRKEGWAAVLRLPSDRVPAGFTEALRANRLFEELTRNVDGGRIFSTTLFNIYFAEDGAMYAGAVTVDRLVEAATK
jgi:outer membrane lipoprotein-sorting protein